MPLNRASKYVLLSVVSISAMLIGSAQLVAAQRGDIALLQKMLESVGAME
jgi:hypothetical protein